jgi:hypothetical protein
MSPSVPTGISPMSFKPRADDDAAELNRFCDALPVASERTTHMLRDVAADAEVSEILARITVIGNELK